MRKMALLLVWSLLLFYTPVYAAKATPTPAPKAKATATPAPKAKATPTPAPKAKATPTPAPKAKATPTPAPKAKATPTPAPKAKATPTPTPAPLGAGNANGNQMKLDEKTGEITYTTVQTYSNSGIKYATEGFDFTYTGPDGKPITYTSGNLFDNQDKNKRKPGEQTTDQIVITREDIAKGLVEDYKKKHPGAKDVDALIAKIMEDQVAKIDANIAVVIDGQKKDSIDLSAVDLIDKNGKKTPAYKDIQKEYGWSDAAMAAFVNRDDISLDIPPPPVKPTPTPTPVPTKIPTPGPFKILATPTPQPTPVPQSIFPKTPKSNNEAKDIFKQGQPIADTPLINIDTIMKNINPPAPVASFTTELVQTAKITYMNSGQSMTIDNYSNQDKILTIKSGYGIEILIESSVILSSSIPMQKPTAIQYAQIKPANYGYFEIAGKRYVLDRTNYVAVDDKWSSSFGTPVNLDSPLGRHEIIIPQSLPDGTYDILIHIDGATSPGGSMTNEITGKITIKGHKDEDFNTGS